jgi:para-nitrobenzyl esterase
MALSQAMMDSLGAFARSGDPNHAGLGVSWQPWRKQLIFDASASQLTVSSR